MGVDIRLHTEISLDGKYWHHSGGFRPDPHPVYFGLLSDGIRGSDLNGFSPRGLPKDVTNKTLSDWGTFVEDANGFTGGIPFRPSWFKANAKGAYLPVDGTFRESYLDLDGFSNVVSQAKDRGVSMVEYEAILEYMKKLGEEYQVRVVYFFDN